MVRPGGGLGRTPRIWEDFGEDLNFWHFFFGVEYILCMELNGVTVILISA